MISLCLPRRVQVALALDHVERPRLRLAFRAQPRGQLGHGLLECIQRNPPFVHQHVRDHVRLGPVGANELPSACCCCCFDVLTVSLVIGAGTFLWNPKTV